jgi:hypothetical protein
MPQSLPATVLIENSVWPFERALKAREVLAVISSPEVLKSTSNYDRRALRALHFYDRIDSDGMPHQIRSREHLTRQEKREQQRSVTFAGHLSKKQMIL